MTDQQNAQHIDAMIQSIITYTRGFNEFGQDPASACLGDRGPP